MSVYHRSTAKSRILQEYRNREEEIAAALSRQMNQKTGVESEKRMRREIANSNERRRMQSINAGFQHLRSMLPHNEGEKLSKAAILQQTTEFIHNIQQEKAKILAQNAYFKRVLNEVSRQCKIDLDMDISLYGGSPPLKRKKRDTESSDEGITADFDDFKYDDMRREVMDLRQKLEQEKQLRMILELRAHQYAEKVQHVTANNNNNSVPAEADEKPLPPPAEMPDKDQREDKATVEQVDAKREDLLVPLQIDLQDADHRVPSSPQHRPEAMETGINMSMSHMSSSMSRRNLETIVEAIRHLEGEGEGKIQASEQSRPMVCPRAAQRIASTDSARPQFYAAISEESENSCIASDGDDLKSESSGRDSPSQPTYLRLHNAQNLTPVHPSAFKLSKVVVSSSSYSEKYPAVTNVLQGNSPRPQMYCRPGVIVQKS